MVNWFTGGAEHSYMPLWHCMDKDTMWVAITVALDLTVAAGYILIAKHWWQNERELRNTPAKVALGRMRNIFIFCGLCGYVFIPVKMVWPAWRLYDLFMVFLAYFTWRYAWGARDLKVVYRELNRSRKLEEELASSQAESRRKSFFLNAISHDLRSPLHGLTLSADVAAMCLDANDAVNAKAAIERIRHSAKESADLLNSFMELGRLDWEGDQTTLEPVDMASLARDVISDFEVQAMNKGLFLRMAKAEGTIVTDRTKLQRIMANLVSNAVKYTNSGGVTLDVSRSADGVVVQVMDTGVGIADEDLPRIFDEFFQVDNDARDSNKGFGLGLAIARRLATHLDAKLSATSELGVGSRFTLFVPCRAAVFNAPEAAATATKPAGRGVGEASPVAG